MAHRPENIAANVASDAVSVDMNCSVSGVMVDPEWPNYIDTEIGVFQYASWRI
jgi:hypothetical protein